ncbi:hypothetical protein KSP35_08580 [Aquihabitans sp. G128]|uniref:hypothetical protein n=1 Tax=Aquihabitans sp. G128 TaxID=2849779 RepID=UPI001C23FE8A|nr:hypothetical protein [Aquihabitans sp. G128]QXC62817.1 hypothetical protein KSP35_08580 [Aquihabitans sp. G128]
MTAVLALAATPTTARRAVPFLSLLGRGTDVVSWHRTAEAEPPAAVLATSTTVLHGLPEVPTAVWVDDLTGLRRAAADGVEVALSSREDLVDHGAVLVPGSGIDVARWPVLPPVARAEQRRALDLPEQFVVAVDHREPTDDIVTILALASAAVVTGPLLPLALALGTPVVTGPDTARRFGLQAGVEVEVASGAAAADEAARSLAAWDLGAAALSRRGRRFAEAHLDLAHPAAAVRHRLGLGALPVLGPEGRLAARLDELATPADARIRARADEAALRFLAPHQGAVSR